MQLLELCREMEIEVAVPENEARKSALPEDGRLAAVVPRLEDEQVDFCVAMGGDGTILRALNRFRDMATPVLGINFGRMGFLSAFGPGDISRQLRPVLAGEFTLLDLCLLRMRLGEESRLAFNDVVVHKPDGGSVIRLAYSVGDVEMDSFQCDGLVAATPAGSTAYNLSNGGPLASLALEAFILSAIAPHTLHSRPLVLAAGERVRIINRSMSAEASLFLDGRAEGSLPPGGEVEISLSGRKAHLVQAAGADFFQTLRQKFIRPQK